MAADIRLVGVLNFHLLLLLLIWIFPTSVLGFASYDFSFTETPQFSVALPGDSVYFSCKTNLPNNQENLTWWHNGKPIQGAAASMSSKGHLTFKVSTDPEVFSKQIGKYQCLAGPQNTTFRLASEDAELSIAYLEDFSEAKHDEIIEIFEGNDIVIPCQVPKSVPLPFIQFERNGQLVDDMKKNAKIINGDTLLLINATKNEAGNYSCVATNHITDQRRTSPNVVQLLVHEPSRNAKSRLIHRPKDNYEVKLGEDVFLPCTSSGVPKPEIIWTKMSGEGGAHFASNPNGGGNGSSLHVENGILMIRGAKQSDTGHYMCAVFNGARRFVRRTSVTVLVPPVFIQTPNKVTSIKEDSNSMMNLKCQASGSPPPSIQWKFNGQTIDESTDEDVLEVNSITGQLVISLKKNDDNNSNDNNIKRSGFYQCFAKNKAGLADHTTFVQVGGRHPSKSSGDVSGEQQDDYDDIFEEIEHIRNYHGYVITSPTRPNITQVDSDSVVLMWDLENSSSAGDPPIIPVKFFKIQFREFLGGGRGGRSNWHTLNEVIDPEVRAFEILGLKSDRKYKFRVVVVFDNNDSKTSPLSKKFRLNAKDYLSLSPKPKKPTQSPEITRIWPLGPTSLRIGWVLNSNSNSSSSSSSSGKVEPEIIEGYFIFYKTATTGVSGSIDEKFKKITILGATTHSHIIEALVPQTEYKFKISSFNLSGSSPASNVSTNSTLPLPPLPSSEIFRENDDDFDQIESSFETSSKSSDTTSNEKIINYLIIGGVFGGCIVMLLLFCAICSYCQRKKKSKFQKSCAGGAKGHHSSTMNDIVERYNDTAVQISHSNHQSFSNLANSKSNQSFLLNSAVSTKEILSNGGSHFEMNLIPDGGGRGHHHLLNHHHQHGGRSAVGTGADHGNKNYSVSDSMFSSGNNSHSADLNSVGHEEYFDEPSRRWPRSSTTAVINNSVLQHPEVHHQLTGSNSALHPPDVPQLTGIKPTSGSYYHFQSNNNNNRHFSARNGIRSEESFI